MNNPYTGDEDGIVFAGLPVDSTIKVYTVSGKHVATLFPSGSDGKATWDVQDSNDEDVAPGVYLCVVKHGGKKKVLKVMVVW